MGRLLLGVVIGIILVPVAGWTYLKYGHPPVAVADKPFPFEVCYPRSHARAH